MGKTNTETDSPVSLPPAVCLGRTGRFLIFYSTALIASLWLAYELRFDFNVPPELRGTRWRMMAGVVPLQLFWLYAFHQFHLLPAYFGIPGVMRMFWAQLCSAVVLGCLHWQFGLDSAPPRGVILINFLLALGSLSLMCMFWRLWRHKSLHRLIFFDGGGKPRKRVAIIGAGDAGVALAQELQRKEELGLYPVMFLDDDRTKWSARLVGIPVLGPPELLKNGVVKSYQLEEIILSMPSASAVRLREVVELARKTSLKYTTVPSMGELAQGRYQISNLRPVQIEDLLGRDPVPLETDAINKLIRGRCVMVTGAGGSIGSELCRQIAANQPTQLLLVDRCEVQMFPIEQELIRKGYKGIIRPLVADILNQARMRKIFLKYAPELIYHAAAHKHVPLMEAQPGEAIRNNSFGTAQMAELAAEFGVDRFVLISTDKAINPTSVMGATKRLAEMFLQAKQAETPDSTKFMAVRFGNVLGSSGSVVPVFREQIAAGGPVTVTHSEMTRYFMTIPEAVGLVVQTSVLGCGGEIFVLDMGKPVRIYDLATQMIKLSGLEPERDIKIQCVGMRPGEKLFEEISYSRETVTITTHPKIMRLRGSPPQLNDVREFMQDMEHRLFEATPAALRELLQKAIPEYNPNPDGSKATAKPALMEVVTGG